MVAGAIAGETQIKYNRRTSLRTSWLLLAHLSGARQERRAMSDRSDTRVYERTLNPALHGCETFDFSPGDLDALHVQVQTYNAFSIHAPLPTPPDYPGHAATSFLLDPDPMKRQATLGMLRQTIEVADEWGALYVVVHFGGVHSEGLPKRRVLALADSIAAELNAVAQEHDVALHIEYAAYNPSFALPQELAELVSRYPYLYICTDIGHVRVGAEMLGLDEWEIVRTLAPYTCSMHLWTTRGKGDVRRYHHVPVHPSLAPADGWIDVPRMLEAVLLRNPDCAIVLEPDSLYNADPSWQAEGVAWVSELVARYRA